MTVNHYTARLLMVLLSFKSARCTNATVDELNAFDFYGLAAPAYNIFVVHVAIVVVFEKLATKMFRFLVVSYQSNK